jgi:serine/threonine protein kinase
VGEILDGRYRLESVIARGGMGVVMSATHLQLDRMVAIKFLHAHLAGDDTLWKRFQREVSISKELNHTNIVRIFDFGESESGYMFLVMEYLEGEELKTMTVREGPQSTTRVLAIAEQVLDGLAEAHSAEVIHRDLKPGNIYMTTDRRGRDVPKILDFGIAKSLQPPAICPLSRLFTATAANLPTFTPSD